MNYKAKLLIIKLLNFLLVVFALVAAYFYFHQAYIGFLEKDIAYKITKGKQGISQPLFESKQHFSDRKPMFIAMHKDAMAMYNAEYKALHANKVATLKEPLLLNAESKKSLAQDDASLLAAYYRKVDLEKIKSALAQKYRVPNTEIQLFLVNRDYKVFDTTYPKDLGFDLSPFPETVDVLNKAFSNKQIHLSDYISRDPLDMKYKMYSYAQTDSDTVLELGFVDNNSKIALFQAMNALGPDLSATLYHVIKDGENLFYFPVSEKNGAELKETLYSSQYRFKPNDPKRLTDPVMQAYLQKKSVMLQNKNAYHVYASVYDLQLADVKTEYDNIVLRFDIDTTEKNAFLKSIQTIFMLVALLSVAGMLALYYVLKREMEQPFDLITQNIKEGAKVPLSYLPNKHDEFYTVAHEYNRLHDKFSAEVQKNADLLLVDHLTKINNRKAFDLKIQELLDHYKRYKQTFSMLMLDIDDFKQINDILGHQAGDQLLCDFTQLVSRTIRETDFFYRTGGEEFIILFPSTSHEDAVVISNKIREAVEMHFSDMREKATTISGGLCSVKSYDTSDSLFKCTDMLLYRAKEQGKNRIVSQLDCC